MHSALRRDDSAWIFLLAPATLGEGVDREEGMRLLGSHHQPLKRQEGKVTTQKILISYTGNIFDYEAGQTVEPEEFHREVLLVEAFSTY